MEVLFDGVNNHTEILRNLDNIEFFRRVRNGQDELVAISREASNPNYFVWTWFVRETSQHSHESEVNMKASAVLQCLTAGGYIHVENIQIHVNS